MGRTKKRTFNKSLGRLGWWEKWQKWQWWNASKQQHNRYRECDTCSGCKVWYDGTINKSSDGSILCGDNQSVHEHDEHTFRVIKHQ